MKLYKIFEVTTDISECEEVIRIVTTLGIVDANHLEKSLDAVESFYVEKMKKNIKILEDSIKSRSAEISSLRKQSSALEKQIKAIDTPYTSKYYNLRADVSRIQSKINLLENYIATTKKQIPNSLDRDTIFDAYNIGYEEVAVNELKLQD